MQKIPMPPKDELRHLLFDLKLTKKQVGKIYAIGNRTLNDWMRAYDLVNKISVSEQQMKRDRRRELIIRSLCGQNIVQKGFNSEFLEEYNVEIEQEKITRDENYQKRKEKRITKVKNK